MVRQQALNRLAQAHLVSVDQPPTDRLCVLNVGKLVRTRSQPLRKPEIKLVVTLSLTRRRHQGSPCAGLFSLLLSFQTSLLTALAILLVKLPLALLASRFSSSQPLTSALNLTGALLCLFRVLLLGSLGPDEAEPSRHALQMRDGRARDRPLEGGRVVAPSDDALDRFEDLRELAVATIPGDHVDRAVNLDDPTSVACIIDVSRPLTNNVEVPSLSNLLCTIRPHVPELRDGVPATTRCLDGILDGIKALAAPGEDELGALALDRGLLAADRLLLLCRQGRARGLVLGDLQTAQREPPRPRRRHCHALADSLDLLRRQRFCLANPVDAQLLRAVGAVPDQPRSHMVDWEVAAVASICLPHHPRALKLNGPILDALHNAADVARLKPLLLS